MRAAATTDADVNGHCYADADATSRGNANPVTASAAP